MPSIVQYQYPTAAELGQIDPDYMAPILANDPLFRLFPMVNDPNDMVMWEQRDSYGGMTQVRGLNGKPQVVKRPGTNWFMAQPGYYGEFITLDEMELTRRTANAIQGSRNFVSIDDMVASAQQQLIVRETNRVRWVMWQLLVYGVFQVVNGLKAVVHSDSYDQQVYTASVPWATSATATPLQDFENVKLTYVGRAAQFGRGAVAFMNGQTWAYLRRNTNAADLGARINNVVNPLNSLTQFNALLQGDDLPAIEVYDEGYIDEATNTWTRLLPDNVVVVVGNRPNGARAGDFAMTRNINQETNIGAPGPYYRVFDRGEETVPREIEVHRGFSGGPRIYYPGSIVVMKV